MTLLFAPEDTESKLIYELGNHQWDIPAVRALLEQRMPGEDAIEDAYAATPAGLRVLESAVERTELATLAAMSGAARTGRYSPVGMWLDYLAIGARDSLRVARFAPLCLPFGRVVAPRVLRRRRL